MDDIPTRAESPGPREEPALCLLPGRERPWQTSAPGPALELGLVNEMQMLAPGARLRICSFKIVSYF